MLGTRIILMALDDFPESAEANVNAEVVAAANHQIPLFWLIGFQLDDLQVFTVAESDDNAFNHGTGSGYPILIARKDALVQVLDQRRLFLQEQISEADSELLQRWQLFLAELAQPVVAIDTYELWCSMADPEQLQRDLKRELMLCGLIDQGKAEPAFEQLSAAGRWQGGNGIALAGFGW